MNAALAIGLILFLMGSKRLSDDKQPPAVDPGEQPKDRATKWGTITFEGVRNPIQVFGKTIAVDYDFKVIINGFKQDGSPLQVQTGNWDYRNSAEKIFGFAWDKYINQGGDPVVNFNVIYTPKYYEMAEKDAKLDQIMAVAELIFGIRSKIESKIPPDIRDKIEIIINAQ